MGLYYDVFGRRTQITRANGLATNYSYDAASRLTQMVQHVTGTAHDLISGFSYNPARQIVATTRSHDAYSWTDHYNVNRAYTANGLNQLTQSGPIVPTHDARGNLTSAGSPTFGYTVENRLRTVGNTVIDPTGSPLATLGYDPLGRLSEIASTGLVRFLYDGPRVVAELDASNTIQRRYVHGPGVDEPLLWYEGLATGDRRFLHADERGSIIAISDGAGAVHSAGRPHPRAAEGCEADRAVLGRAAPSAQCHRRCARLTELTSSPANRATEKAGRSPVSNG